MNFRKYSTLLRYGAVFAGTLTILVGVFILLHNLHILAAKNILLLTSILSVASFIGYKLFVFQNKNTHPLVNLVQYLLFLCTLGFNVNIGLILAAIAPDQIAHVILIGSIGIVSITNYWIYKRLFALRFSRLSSSNIQSLFSRNVLRNIGLGFALCVPIFLFSFGLLQSGQKIIPGDPDYYIQLWEAFRRSLLEFHQLPFWNGWVAGGIPLFGNIQFGLISIQTPFVVLFGSVMGMKLAVVAYQIIGFFGFKRLFERGFKTSGLRAILLAYIPVFGSFFVDRVVAGHYTFLLIAFVPWLILFYLQRRKTFSWLFFALTFSIMVWSSPHYVTIMSMVVVGIWFLYEKIGQLVNSTIRKNFSTFVQDTKNDLLFFIKALAAILVLCFYRMFFVIDFISDFPRNNPVTNESFTGIKTGLYAIWGPDQYFNPPSLPSGWGWAEAATYIGIGTAFCLVLVCAVQAYLLIRKRSVAFNYSPILLGALLVTFFILGMGDFGQYAPYTMLSNLPVFDSMRVATRWLMWASLIVLFIIAAYKSKYFNKTINIILLFTVIELFLSGSKVLAGSYFLDTQQYRSPQSSFSQQYKYNLPRALYANNSFYLTNYSYDENLYEATRNNIGQVIAGDSLVDTRQPKTTIRCGENDYRCMHISSNARVVYWSPNKVIIERLTAGPINFNSNVGKGWLVNGEYVFLDYKVTEPLKPTIIDNPSNIIVLEYAPKLSPLWLKETLLP